MSVLAALLLSVVVPGAARAQSHARVVPVAWHAESADAQIQGLVKDDAGSAITGASVLAMGETLAMVRTDERGRFTLRVPPGNYVLRATREGYISRYREPVRITAGEPVTRVITLTRASAATASSAPLQLAGVGAAAATPEAATPEPAAVADPSAASDSSHSAAAWRLRHLPRTVLRDESPTAVAWDDDDTSWPSSLSESLAASASRTAASFLGATDFSGHVDFLTMSSLPGSGPISPVDWPRGVAYVVV
ncbi:MAG TPA: carboxypeptidase-like regulatory domain-containing protein, partial [Vicinamibacterales bacterium]|nr:carboxypeptidase-like regulatory domain-containing protein [Vicinamibacterales bacterium]